MQTPWAALSDIAKAKVQLIAIYTRRRPEVNWPQACSPGRCGSTVCFTCVAWHRAHQHAASNNPQPPSWTCLKESQSRLAKKIERINGLASPAVVDWICTDPTLSHRACVMLKGNSRQCSQGQAMDVLSTLSKRRYDGHYTSYRIFVAGLYLSRPI